MKLLLLLTLVGLAASRYTPLRTGQPQQFLFEYSTQLATGIEEVSNQFSTLRMRMEMLMQTDGSLDRSTGAQVWKLAFQRVNVRQRNNATEQLPETLLPMEMFKDLENVELWRQIEAALKQPFKCWITPKLSIVKIEFEKEDPFWSVNIKKGFLQLLQLNFLPKEEGELKNQWTKEQDEMTVADKCKSFYSVEKVRFHEATSKVYKVEKAIDFNNCKNPIDGTRNLPGMWNGLQHTDRIPTQMDKKILNINNVGKFFVYSNAEGSNFFVKRASMRTIYTLAPYTQSLRGSEKVIAIQKLKLLARANEPEIEFSDLIGQPEGLRLIFPQEAKIVQTEVLINEVVKMLKKLKPQKFEEKLDMKVYEQIVRIVRFHMKKPEQLLNIVMKLKEQVEDTTEVQRLIRIFILDICPQANTDSCVQFLMKVIRMILKDEEHKDYVSGDNIFGIQDIPIIFSKLSLMGKIQLKTLKTVFDLVKSERFRAVLLTGKTMPIYSSAWLSLGGMVNVYFSRQGGVEPYLLSAEKADFIRQYRNSPWELRRQHAVKSEEFRQQFIIKVREMLEASTVSRALAIKVIKNCGLFEFYQDLKTIMNSRDSVSTTDRVEAVYATQNMLRRQTLSRLTTKDVTDLLDEQKFIVQNKDFIQQFDRISRQIQADLLRCFRNVRADPELRIACYRVLIQAPIKQFTLNILVQSVLADPSQVVYTYCVQHMMQIVKTPLPRYQRCIPTIRSALSMLKRRQQFIPTFSRVFGSQMWDQLHDMGFSVETDMIVSDKSFTPRWTHLRLEHQSFGRSLPLIEIGVRTEGLQKVLEKFFGPRGSISSFNDMIKKLARSRRSLADGKINVAEMLQILPRVLEEMPNMEICLSLMGYDVIFVRNSPEVRQLMQTVTLNKLRNYMLSFKQNLQLLTNVFTIGNYYELPTPVGTILDFSSIASFNFKLNKLGLGKTIGEEEKKLTCNLKMQPLLTVQAFSRVGSNMHLLNHYHQWETVMNVGLPQETEMKLKIDISNKMKPQMNFAFTIPKRKTQLFSFVNKAYSTIAEFYFADGNLQTQYIKDDIKHRSIAQAKTFSLKPLINKVLAFCGIQLEINGRFFSNDQLFQGPCNLLNGPSTFSIHVQPIVTVTGSPIFVDGQLKYSLKESDKSLKDFSLEMNIKKSRDQTVLKKLVKLQYKTLEWMQKTLKFETNLRWFVNLPSSLSTEGFAIKTLGEIQMPEDLKMPKANIMTAQWMKTYQWVKDRLMKLKLEMTNEEIGEIGTLTVTTSANKAIKQLMQKMTQKQLQQTYPLLKKCQKEAKKTAESEYNPIFTPSCVEQFKQFNKLSEMKLTMVRKVDWFLNWRKSQLLNTCLQMLGRYLQPFLAESVIRQVPDNNNRVLIESRPSPLDMRVHNVKVTCDNWQKSWKSIQLPATPFYWAGVDPVITAITDHVKGGAVKCSLRHSHVKTFDNVIYSMPKMTYKQIAENECPVLLAADCSQRKEFNVLTHVKDNQKIVVLQAAKKSMKIEISKHAKTQQKDAVVKVLDAVIDQDVYSEDAMETLIYSRTIQVDSKPLTFTITKYPYADTSMYKVICKELQIELLVGGPMLRTVELRVSPFYHNKICGLCGDYNSEKMREFKGPKLQVQTSAQQMVQQYVLPVNDQCRAISLANQNAINDYDNTFDSLVSMPTFHLYSRHDELKQRQSCQLSVKDKYVKTFYHREMPILTKAIQQFLSRSGCNVNLAVADILDSKVGISFDQVTKKIVLKVNDNQVEIPTTHAALQDFDLPLNALDGLNCKVDKVEKGLSQIYRVTVLHPTQQQHKFVMDISNDRVFIRKGKFVEGRGVCQLAHKSQLAYSSSQQVDKVLNFITLGNECKNMMKRHLMQCDIKQKVVVPFHRSGDFQRQQVKFLTQELMQMMAEKPNAVLVLSVDRSDNAAAPYSTQMSFSMKNDKIVRHLFLKKGHMVVAEIRVPQDEADKSAKTKIIVGDQVLRTADCVADRDIGNGFRCKFNSEQKKLTIYKTGALYDITVQLQHEKPIVQVHSLIAHPQLNSHGLCGATNPISEFTHSNPHAILINGLQKTLNVEKVVSNVAKVAINDLIQEINDFEYLPEY